MMRTIAAMVLLVAAGAAEAAQPIGRLFFTPGERAQLDVARATKRVAEPPGSAASKPSEPPPPETQIITYSGIVRRSDGKSILWLNSRAADEKEALSGLAVSGRVRPDGAVTLTVPNTGGTIDLKVGQRAELQTGRVSEARPQEKDAAAPKDAAASKDAAPSKGDGASKGDGGSKDAKDGKAGDAAKGAAADKAAPADAKRETGAPQGDSRTAAKPTESAEKQAEAAKQSDGQRAARPSGK